MLTWEDVHALQTQVHDYRTELQSAVDGLATLGQPLSMNDLRQWANLVGQCASFETESAGIILVASQYSRGLSLWNQLNQWRSKLDGLKAPDVPTAPAAPLPESGDIVGGLQNIALLIVIALALANYRK